MSDMIQYQKNNFAFKEKIPVNRIIYKLDDFFNKNDLAGAQRTLEFWKEEAVRLKDMAGELSMQSELVGLYRKIEQKEKCLDAVSRTLFLVDALAQNNMASGGTIYLNCATAYKAFGMSDKSIPLYEKAEKIYKNTLKEDDVRFGGLYNNLALALVDLGRFEQAKTAYLSAISVMEKVDSGKADLAITYVNMAHMFENLSDTAQITNCMFTAYNLLNDEGVEKNGYYAYVCQKCAPSFKHFGYDIISKELNELSKEIYERFRNI